MGNWDHPDSLGVSARAFRERTRRAQIAVFVDMVLPGLRDAARSVGYSLTEHGTQARDLDLVAVPWTDRAVEADELIKLIRSTCHSLTGWGYSTGGEPTQKPHGRIAVTILGSDDVHLDLSIMPRVPKKEQPDEPD